MKWWWLKLARYAIPQWGSLTAIFALLVAGIGLGLLNPWPLQVIVDHVLSSEPLPESLRWLQSLPGSNSPRGLLAWLAAATVLLFLARRVLAIAQSYLQAGAGSHMVYHLATDLFDHLQARSALFHQRQRLGDLVRRITADTACVRDLVINVGLPLVTAVATLVSMFVIVWQISTALALFAAALAIPLWLVIRRYAGPMADRKHEEWQLQGELSALAEQTLTAIPLVQGFGREEHEEQRFRQLARRTVAAGFRSEVAGQRFRASAAAVSAVAAATVMVFGGWAVLDGQVSVGSLLVLIAYFAALYAPIESLAYLSEGFASASAGARRVLEVIESDDHGARNLPGARPLPDDLHDRGISVRFDGVTFGYEPERDVLQNLSFAVHAGETLAVVGATGAGKSTLCSLILRMFDPWQGSVQFNESDIRHFDLTSLRRHVAVVLQEPLLLPLSIADNIAYGRPEASRDQIIVAATAARADEFIGRLPGGYDTVIGERGITLSGGERQRLAIARALLKDAPVLILDEPTSALDAATESALVEALARLTRGRTTFVIAHRLSTIRGADRILVLDQGRLAEIGSHEELLATGGVYARLHHQQFCAADAQTSQGFPPILENAG